MIFYAAVGKYLDDIPIQELSEFEKGFFSHMDALRPDVGRTIKSSGELSSEAEASLKAGIEEYKAEFLKSLVPDAKTTTVSDAAKSGEKSEEKTDGKTDSKSGEKS